MKEELDLKDIDKPLEYSMISGRAGFACQQCKHVNIDIYQNDKGEIYSTCEKCGSKISFFSLT